jgi:hypothetical protein
MLRVFGMFRVFGMLGMVGLIFLFAHDDSPVCVSRVDNVSKDGRFIFRPGVTACRAETLGEAREAVA